MHTPSGIVSGVCSVSRQLVGLALRRRVGWRTDYKCMQLQVLFLSISDDVAPPGHNAIILLLFVVELLFSYESPP